VLVVGATDGGSDGTGSAKAAVVVGVIFGKKAGRVDCSKRGVHVPLSTPC
jgi:hypothetical protein